MTQNGWLKLHRQIITSDIWTGKPAEYLKIWIYILLTVNHEDTKQFKKGSNFFRWSRDKVDLPEITEHQWHHCITWLKQARQIATQKTTRGNVITVLNYSKYQSQEESKATPKATRSAKHLLNTSDTIKKELKNGRIDQQPQEVVEKPKNQVNQIIDIFHDSVNPTINYGNKTTRVAVETLIKEFGYEELEKICIYACEIQGEPFTPVITTPYHLKEKYGQLKIYKDKNP